jgi:polyisoprenoid-binding protein YceI
MKRIVLFILALSWVVAQSDLVLNPDSFIEYEAKDQGNAWIGKAGVSSLELTLNPTNVSASSLTLSVKAENFNSGNIFRDTNARRTVFDTSEYPDITFVAKRVSSANNTLAEGDNEISLSGDLTLHGVTKELSTLANVTISGQTLSARGSFEVNMLDFGMKPPELFGIVVNEIVTIRFSVMGEF